MSLLKNVILTEIMDILKNEDVKLQIRLLFKPIIDMLLADIYPYIMLSMVFVIISFFYYFRKLYFTIA